MGAKPEEAFFVSCDRTTMSDDDILNGRLVMEIGIAPVRPAEFVIIRIGQWLGGSRASRAVSPPCTRHERTMTMATGDRVDPFRGFNFRVEIGSTSDAVAAFREVSGLTFNIDPIEYREGNSHGPAPEEAVRAAQVRRTSCSSGASRTNDELWLWYRQIVNGVADRRNGAVVLLDEQHNDVLRWNFYEAWLCKWEGPTFNATTNEVAIESIEICVEKLELVV